MADQTRYQVVSACVVVPIDEAGGPVMHTLYRGHVFEANADNSKIKHNADAGYIVELAKDAVAGVDGSGTPLVNDKPTVGKGNPGAPAATNDPGVANEAAHKAAAEGAEPADAATEAKAKPGRPSASEKATLVDQAVAAGMSRTEAEKASVADLRAALAK